MYEKESIRPMYSIGVNMRSGHEIESNKEKNRTLLLGVTIRDRIKNNNLRQRIGVHDIIERITRLKWFKHVVKVRDGLWTKKTLRKRPLT